jgi:hypothetical protein
LSALADLQQRFAGTVRGLPGAEVPDIADTDIAATRRLAIYRNHHRISLADALAANFPTVAALLGATVFEGAATDFIAAMPPMDPRVSTYGAGFAGFLDAERRLQAVPYIADVARLDWAMNKAERAEDVAVFGAADLERAISRGLADLRLTAHPSLALLRSVYPLLKIRALARSAGDAVSLDDGGVLLMVWRRGDVVDVAELDAAAYQFVTAMSVGEPLSVAARDLAAEQLSDLLARYVMTGAFAAPGI